MKKIIIIVLALIITLMAKDYTLEDCIAIGMEKNLDIIQRDLELKNSELNTKSTLSNFYDIGSSYNAGYSYTNTESQIGDNDSQNTELTKLSHSLSLSLTGNLSLQLLDSYQISKLSEQYASLNLKDQKDDLIVSITNAFYTALLTKEDVGVQNENIKYNQTQYKETKLRYELGSLTKSELLQAEVNLSNAKLNIISSEKKYDTSRQSLINILNIEEDYKEFNPVNSDANLVMEIPTLDELVDMALENRIDIKSSSISLEQSNLSLESEYHGFLPSLNGSIGMNYGDTYDLDSELNINSYGTTASLGLKWDLSFSDFNKKDMKSVALKKSNVAHQQVINKAKNEVINYYLELMLQKENLESIDKHVELAKENLDLANEMFRLGNKTITDQMKAVNDYISAKYKKIEARYNYLIDYEKLVNSVGRKF
ncbi:MAG: TolC family protein [Candidatus Delongbacteria bacterium]|nr:TolC family protein [Candidatus Delongbacteria bacterium]MBN2836480.1 TolC family protein [Candidatus Delongbacteria bacterium]